jgi:hypothetical protein
MASERLKKTNECNMAGILKAKDDRVKLQCNRMMGRKFHVRGTPLREAPCKAQQAKHAQRLVKVERIFVRSQLLPPVG